MIALDRPGYGASALYPDEMALPERRVELAYGAVDKIARRRRPRRRRVPVGALRGLRAGAADGRRRTRRTTCSASKLAGTGLRYHPDAKAVISQATTTSRPAGLRDLLWQPTDLYPPEVLTGALSAPGAAYEAEVTANWPRRDFPATAAEVRVPVEFSVADHESVWESDPEALAAIAALFTSSPRVVDQRNAGQRAQSQRRPQR